jgi:hypothetical protein
MTVRKAVVVGAICLLAGACSKSAESYGSAADVARELNAKGVSCSHFALSPPGTAGSMRLSSGSQVTAKSIVKQAGSCSTGTGKLLVVTFKDAARRDQWLEVGKLYGSVVVGPNWAISTQSKATADDITGAIGGEVR